MPKPVYLDDIPFERFNSFLLFELKLSNKPSTLRPRKYVFNDVKRYFKRLPFTRTEFASYIAECKISGQKNSTINKKIMAGKQIAQMLSLKEFENVTLFPDKGYQWKDTLTWDEMDQIASTPAGYNSRNARNGHTVASLEHRDYCLIRLLSESGCRREEALRLIWDNLDGNIITFLDTKTAEDRVIIVTDQLSEELRKLPRLRDTVFGLTTPEQINTIVSRKAKLSGIKKKTPISPHLFRHSLITNLGKSGAKLRPLQLLVGHKRLDTTARYLHSDLAEMENMLYAHSGLWEKQFTPDTFMRKALTTVKDLMQHKSDRVKLGEDPYHYLIKIPKNVFTIHS